MRPWKLTACLIMLPAVALAGPPDSVVVRHCATNSNDGTGYSDAILQGCLGQVGEFCAAEGGDSLTCVMREEQAWLEYVAEGRQWFSLGADATSLDTLNAETAEWEGAREAACGDGADEVAATCRRDHAAARALELYFRIHE